MRRISRILPILLFVGTSSFSKLQQDDAKDPLYRRMDGFQLQNETVRDALAKFNMASELSMSVETILKENLSERNVEFPRFDLKIEGGRARDVLDRICALDSRFKWSRYKNTINVYPKSALAAGGRYFLNRKQRLVQFKNLSDPAQAVIRTVALLPGPLEQIAFSQVGGAGEFSVTWNPTFKNVTVRQVLDEIAEHLCSGCGWTFSGAKNFRVIRVHSKLLPEQKSAPRDK